MTGMDVVVELRQDRVKPFAVFVDLVDTAPRTSEFYALSAQGNVKVTIPKTDSLADIDFRPLVGLEVHLHDFTGDTAWQIRVAAAIAEADPARLIVPMWDGDDLVIHQRWAGPPVRTETIRT